jgi:hypothetical protein
MSHDTLRKDLRTAKEGRFLHRRLAVFKIFVVPETS